MNALIFYVLFFMMFLFPTEMLGNQRQILRIAVASNFSHTARQIGHEFEKDTGIKIEIIVGSTGKLYSQIMRGAPFDVFLSADQETVTLLEDAGKIKAETRLTYCSGRLVFWSKSAIRKHSFQDQLRLIRKKQKLALANEKTAPYGRASIEVLRKTNSYLQLKDQLVFAENVSQVFHYVNSNNVDFAFLALSQVLQNKSISDKSYLLIETDLHRPILQDGAVISFSKNNDVAIKFINFLKSEKSKTLIKKNGYNL